MGIGLLLFGTQQIIETDEERTYFLIDVPCHQSFIADKVALNKERDIQAVKGLYRGRGRLSKNKGYRQDDRYIDCFTFVFSRLPLRRDRNDTYRLSIKFWIQTTKNFTNNDRTVGFHYELKENASTDAFL